MDRLGVTPEFLQNPKYFCGGRGDGHRCGFFDSKDEIRFGYPYAKHVRQLRLKDGSTVTCQGFVLIVVFGDNEPRFFSYTGYGNDHMLCRPPEDTVKEKMPPPPPPKKQASHPKKRGQFSSTAAIRPDIAYQTGQGAGGNVTGHKAVQIFIICDRQNTVYCPGENVSGKAIIVLDSPLSVQEVQISLVGEAHVYWRRSNQRFTDNEELFKNATKLWPTNESGPSHQLSPTMPAGNHEFKFSLPIPEKTRKGLPLPAPMEFDEVKKVAYIRYFLEVRIVRTTLHFDQKHREYVSILEVYDLNADSLASVPVAVSNGKTIRSWYCASGQIDVSINLPKSGYTIGENLAASIEIANNSPRIVKEVRLVLIQECEFGNFNGVSRTVDKSEMSEMIKVEPVLPGQTRHWENEGFLIPSFTRPTMSAEVCRIIKYSHHLFLQVVPSGRRSKFEMHVPILIGTIPVTTSAPDTRSSLDLEMQAKIAQ